MPPGDNDSGNIFGDMFKNLGEQARKDFEASFQPNFDFDKITTLMDEIETGAAEIANKFGQGRVNMVALQASMGDALAKVTEMGGSFDDIVSAQKAVTNELGRNLIVQSDTFEKLYATQKITGQDTQTLVKGFKDAGFSLSHIQDEMKKVVEIAQKQGVSAQAVSKQVVANMDAMNKYNFEGGVAGMAKMAAQATSLRIDMKTALDFADKMFNPEQAIEMSAALQRLGVTQSQLLDPLRMMDLAQNDPAELQNQIVEMTKGFVQLNKAGQFEILPDGKRQLREIAQAMNIPYEQLTKMAIGSKELEEKMSKIRFPAEFQDEEAQKMIANMAEFNKETQRYEITYTDPKTGQAVTKGVEEVTAEDIAEAQKEAGKSMEDLTKEQVSTSKRIENILAAMATKSGVVLAGSGFVEKGRAATVSTYEAIAEPFNRETSDLNTKKLRSTLETKGSEGFDALMQGDFNKAFKVLGEGEKYFEGALNNYVKDVGDNFSKLAKSGDPVIEGFMKVGGFLKRWVEKTEKIAPKPDENKSENQKLKVDNFIKEKYDNNELNVGGNKSGDGSKEGISKVDVGGNIKLEITATGDTDALKRELETNPSLSQMITMKVIQSVNPNINPNEMNQKISDMSYSNLG